MILKFEHRFELKLRFEPQTSTDQTKNQVNSDRERQRSKNEHKQGNTNKYNNANPCCQSGPFYLPRSFTDFRMFASYLNAAQSKYNQKINLGNLENGYFLVKAPTNFTIGNKGIISAIRKGRKLQVPSDSVKSNPGKMCIYKIRRAVSKRMATNLIA